MKAFQLSGMLLLIVVWFPVNLAWSCAFDTDCQPGSRCVKAYGSIYGVCVGGISPGNRNDREPAHFPLDPNRTYGNACQFDTDCGPESACGKGMGSIYGTCMRR
jgi:hypothetical protein